MGRWVNARVVVMGSVYCFFLGGGDKPVVVIKNGWEAQGKPG